MDEQHGEAERESTISGIILDFLAKEGIDAVFGIPGGYNLYFMREFSLRRDVRFIRAQHEGGAAFMADGYARESRKFGCLLSTAGPGATNTITGIISSYADSTPILSIVGSVPIGKRYRGAIQDTQTYGIDTSNVFNEITRFHATVNTRETFMHIFRNAVTHLFKGRRGPVLLNVASDLFASKVGADDGIDFPYLIQERSIDTYALDALLSAMSMADSMVILAGFGVQLASAEDELADFAARLGIPVMTTPKGKASFDNDSELYLGVHGLGANVIPERYLENENVDIVLIIGTSFNEFASNTWAENLSKGKRIYHLDIDPYVIGRVYPSSVGIVGDAKSALSYLNARISEIGPEPFAGLNRLERMAEYRDRYDNIVQRDKYEFDGLPMKPQRLMKAIRDAFHAENVSVFIDIGQIIWWAGHYLKLRKGWKYHASLGFSSMGYAISAAIGGKIASPGRVVIALSGDGGALMNGNELKTAAEYGVAVFFFVLNDGNLNIIRHSTRLMFGKDIEGVRHGARVDFAAFAESLGVRGMRIDDPAELTAELIEGLVEAGGPVLFDCMIDPNEMANIEKRIQAVSLK